jgi:4-carboxymuconolactone decarboxylase
MARLPPVTSKDQVAAEHRAVFDSIVQSRGAVQGPFTMFLHSPELAGRVAHLGAYVRFEGSLDMRVRVLAAMTVAREFEAVYVWGAQAGGARRLGVPETTITAIRENHSRGIPPEDAEIVEFTRQLLRKHRIDEASAGSLRRRFGDDGFIQLTGAIGYYSMLAMTVNACELEAAYERRGAQGLRTAIDVLLGDHRGHRVRPREKLEMHGPPRPMGRCRCRRCHHARRTAII